MLLLAAALLRKYYRMCNMTVGSSCSARTTPFCCVGLIQYCEGVVPSLCPSGEDSLGAVCEL